LGCTDSVRIERSGCPLLLGGQAFLPPSLRLNKHPLFLMAPAIQHTFLSFPSSHHQLLLNRAIAGQQPSSLRHRLLSPASINTSQNQSASPIAIGHQPWPTTANLLSSNQQPRPTPTSAVKTNPAFQADTPGLLPLNQPVAPQANAQLLAILIVNSDAARQFARQGTQRPPGLPVVSHTPRAISLSAFFFSTRYHFQPPGKFQPSTSLAPARHIGQTGA